MSEVIAAVSTAPGEGGISVIRLSGSGSVGVVDRFFSSRRSLADTPARYMTLGSIVISAESGGGIVDQVLAVRFEQGASYTGEESAEVHCHGGFAASARCMELFLSGGARLAEPGEFTKRAFLSGRIDLAQAEAVLAVVRASGDATLSAAGRALQGELSLRIHKLMSMLTALRAELEVRIDYPEEVDAFDMHGLLHDIGELCDSARELTERCRVGMTLRDGLGVAIIGRPNVGKSSLLNLLAGEERAIVTDMPGTTRDTIDAVTIHRGLVMRFTDTAGIRESDDEIERIGVERSLAAIGGADICIVVLDSSSQLTDEDREIISRVTADKGKFALLILNKCDLVRESSVAALADSFDSVGSDVRVVETSAVTGEGLSALKDALFDLALGGSPIEGSYAATARMTEALAGAVRCMEEAMDVIRVAALPDVVGSLLGEAAMYLASPLGIDASEELIDTVFSSFCVGK